MHNHGVSFMNLYRIRKQGGIECLELTSDDCPRPGPHDVLVKVRAVSLNYRDLITIGGTLGPLGKADLVPASDGAGDVVEIGSRVSRFAPGDRVVAIFRQAWISGPYRMQDSASDLGGSIDGMLSEFVILNEEGLVACPAHLSFEEASTLPCAAVTAWNSVVTRGQIRVGETLLVQGSGGVALFALQFGKRSGACVIATTSSDQKAEKLRALGADHVINYRETPAWEKEVLALTGGRGADLVVDNGGPGTWSKSIAAARIGGRVMLVGLLTGVDESKSGAVFLPIFMRETLVTSVHVGSRDMFEDMNRAIMQHKLRPVIDMVFPFERVPEAYLHLQGAGHFGKVVIQME
jgi:NADPH:quinone reductase-like Zn-dependent oxidoreductase